mmetsp:Transcript_1646/g.4514  ORF Transcript_1646/g.4514 Transcript_1646/m.4514 type:complete len:233 (-) Transcript_1646:58-756(-)
MLMRCECTKLRSCLLLLLLLLLPHSRRRMILHPLRNPLLHAQHIAFRIFRRIRWHLMHNLHGVRFAGLLQDDLHDLGLHVLRSLLFRIPPSRQSIKQQFRLGPQHQDQVEPTFGEQFCRMKIRHEALSRGGDLVEDDLECVQQLVLVQYVCVQRLVVTFVKVILFDQFANVDMMKSRAFRQQLGRRCFANTRSAGDEDVGHPPLGSIQTHGRSVVAVILACFRVCASYGCSS